MTLVEEEPRTSFSLKKEPSYNNMYQEMYGQKCKKILKMQYIRFAAMINESGKIVAGGFLGDKKARRQTLLSQVYLDDILKEISASVKKKKA